MESLESRQLLSSAQDITGLAALRADANYVGVDGSGVGVAVIDTGTWAAHPDLQKNFAAFFDGVTTRYTANASTNVASAFDPDGHGTHTAGTAVSSNPEIGVATAAKLVAIRGIPSQADPVPQFDTVLNSLQWVAAHYQQYNIKVVNMSLGDYTTNFNVVPGGKPAIFSELERLGITTVISSGNNYGNFASLGAASPGVYGTLTVANTWSDDGPTADFPIYGGNGDTINYVAGENDAAPDRLAATSQRSTLPNQVAAPGEEILSTWNNPSKLYNRLSGTSMSAPFVSGVVALMQDAAFTYGGRYLTTGEVQSIVRGTADTIVDSNVSTNFRVPVTFDSSGQVHRAGPNQDLPETGQTFLRVNAYHAVQAVRNLVTSGTPTPDPSPAPAGDANNTTATAVVVPSLDATQQYQFTGNIGLDGQVQVGANDVDLFRVDLEARGVLTFATSGATGGTSFDAFLRLFDSNGNQIAFADDTSGLYPTLQSVRLAAGRYYFGVSSFNNTAYTTSGSGAADGRSAGDYNLTVSLTNADPNGVAAGAAAVDLADPDTINPNTNLPANFFNGAIGSDPNPLDPSGARVQIGPTDVDMFQVTAPDDGVLFVDTDAVAAGLPDAVDTYVRIFDADLNQVAFNDDSNGTTDSFVQLNVSAGDTFYVAVTTFGNRAFNPADPFDRTSTTNVTGSYRLYLYFSNGDADGTVFSSRDAAAGATLNGEIGQDDGRPLLGADGGDKDVDFYRYTASTDGLLEFTAADTDGVFSPVLTLWKFDAQTNSIQRVRNTAGADARLITEVAAGDVYYVSVTGLGNNDFKWYAVASGSGGDTGGYTLQSTVRPLSDVALLVNDSIQSATPETVNAGDTLYRTLGDDGGLDRGAADVDLYRFTPTASGDVVVHATVPGEAATDPFLRVFDVNGTEITYNDDAADGTRDAAITFSVTAGQTYYIGVNGSGDNARGYNPVTGAGAADATAEGDYVLSVGALQPPGSGGTGGQAQQRSIAFDAQTRATYVDADGGVVLVMLKGPGSGTLFFDGDANADAARLVLDNVTAGSALTIKGTTSFGDVTINGSLKGFGGRTIDLRGRLIVSGSLPKLQLNAVSGATINIAGNAPTTLAFGSVSDSSMTFSSAVKSLKLSTWTDTAADSAADALTAPSIASLTASGEFGASLNVDSIGKLKVGSLVGSDVRAASLIASLTANSISGSRVFAGLAANFINLPDSLDDFASGSATIKSISIKGRALTSVVDSLIAAPIIGKASLGGIATDNGGATFGLAADRIASVRGASSLGLISMSRLEDPGESTQLGDFVIRLL